MKELEFGKFYQYPYSTTLYPTTLYPLIEEKGQWKAIKANTPFILLDITVPDGFNGSVLKVLTSDGVIGYIGFSENFLEKFNPSK